MKLKVEKTNTKFLKDLTNTRTQFFYSTGKTSMHKARSLSAALINNTSSYKCDTYFVVNPGGSTTNEITGLRSVFVDLDAGRNSKGKYYPINTVIARKSKMMEAIEAFPLTPHYIVETRNGYQVYWLLNSTTKTPIRLNRWNRAQKLINKYFEGVGADNKVTKCNQIMRVPCTTWYKPWEGVSSHKVCLFSTNQKVKYRIQDFNNTNITKYDGPTFINEKVPVNYSFNRRFSGQRQPATYTTNDTVDLSPTIKNNAFIQDQKNNTVLRTIEFLRDINPVLYKNGNKFMAKSATQIANDLSNNFGIS